MHPEILYRLQLVLAARSIRLHLQILQDMWTGRTASSCHSAKCILGADTTDMLSKNIRAKDHSLTCARDLIKMLYVATSLKASLSSCWSATRQGRDAIREEDGCNPRRVCRDQRHAVPELKAPISMLAVILSQRTCRLIEHSNWAAACQEPERATSAAL